MIDDDILSFADEIDICEDTHDKWIILLVDDDEDVHLATEYAIGHETILNKGILLLHAYSGHEGFDIVRDVNNIDIAIVDMVMETPLSGMELSNSIREVLNKKHIPVIIIRSGQTGSLLEKEVTANPNIDGFLRKGEITKTGLLDKLTEVLSNFG